MLTVSDLMTSEPITVAPDTSLREVIAIMNNKGCRQLPVLDGHALVGIITDRDIRLALNSPVLEEDVMDRIDLVIDMQASDCMSSEPMIVAPTVPATKVAETLALYKFGALPVVDAGRLVGIISVIDYLNHFAAQGS